MLSQAGKFPLPLLRQWVVEDCLRARVRVETVSHGARHPASTLTSPHLNGLTFTSLILISSTAYTLHLLHRTISNVSRDGDRPAYNIQSCRRVRRQEAALRSEEGELINQSFGVWDRLTIVECCRALGLG